MGGNETMALKADETEQVTQAIEQTTHIVFIYVEAFAMTAFILTLCFVVWRVYTNPEVPTTVKNRILFGLLTFGVLIFLVREFGDSLSDDTKALLLGTIGGSILTIVMFLFDKDKETKDNEQSNNH